jgi:transcriptional regulator with XRE-family HTH domain
MNNNLSIVLKELRNKKGLSQEEIAKLINVTQRAYSFYETGNREPKIDTLIKLADIYGVPLDIVTGRYKLNDLQ